MNREELASLSYYYEGNWDKIHTALAMGKKTPLRQISEPYVTCLDDEYPPCLKELACPPFVLFYQGNISLLQKKMAAVIGSREITLEGADVTGRIASILAERYVIVSGLAKGADGIAHRSAIAAGGATIGVCGHGLGTVYPRENADLYRIMKAQHLILSEYPYHTRIAKYHFPWRNRILAALGRFTVVTEAKVKSGTMHTVNEALQLGRDIYCVPYPYGYREGEGCDLLIQEGAGLLYKDEMVRQL
jgi:DNA processing protein